MIELRTPGWWLVVLMYINKPLKDFDLLNDLQK